MRFVQFPSRGGVRRRRGVVLLDARNATIASASTPTEQQKAEPQTTPSGCAVHPSAEGNELQER